MATDDRFEREGADLIHGVSVGLAEAALGTRIEVPLIEGGTADLEIPPGTQPGTSMKMPGLGTHKLGQRSRGDLIVIVEVSVPSALSPEEEEALRRFAELRGEKTNRPAET